LLNLDAQRKPKFGRFEEISQNFSKWSIKVFICNNVSTCAKIDKLTLSTVTMLFMAQQVKDCIDEVECCANERGPKPTGLRLNLPLYNGRTCIDIDT